MRVALLLAALVVATAIAPSPRTTTASLGVGGGSPLRTLVASKTNASFNNASSAPRRSPRDEDAETAWAATPAAQEHVSGVGVRGASGEVGARAEVYSGHSIRDASAGGARGGEYPEAETHRQVYLAGAAYCNKGLETWECLYCNGTSMRDVTVFASAGKNVRGYVGWDADRGRAVVSFRGTEPSSLKNWLENLDASHAQWDVGDVSYRVHAGFLSSYLAVKDQIFTLLAALAAAHRAGHEATHGHGAGEHVIRGGQQRPGGRMTLGGTRGAAVERAMEMEAPPPMLIAITGHSFGGALATLAAFELSTVGLISRRSTIRGVADVSGQTSKVVGVWTFGSPRVGDEFFSVDYGAILGDQTWRVTHAHDIVPSVPYRIMGFHHVPTEVFYPPDSSAPPTVCDSSGEDLRCSDSEWTHASIVDHLYYLETYICGCNI